jgi:ubiquinone/menaquinone biosynthesis C-methylase UbiE
MTIYDLFMEPLEKTGLRRLRKKLIKKASGDVLEIGAGTGLNLPYYREEHVSSVVLMDRDLKSKALKKKSSNHKNLKLIFREENVMNLSFPDDIRRVLKKDGKIIFIEHVRPKSKALGRTFDTATPLWKKLAKGCHLNRKTMEQLRSSGFELKLEGKMMKNIFLGGTGKIKRTAQ